MVCRLPCRQPSAVAGVGGSDAPLGIRLVAGGADKRGLGRRFAGKPSAGRPCHIGR